MLWGGWILIRIPRNNNPDAMGLPRRGVFYVGGLRMPRSRLIRSLPFMYYLSTFVGELVKNQYV